MRTIQLLDDGTLLVPTRVEGNGVVGDAMREITVGDDDYEKFLQQYRTEQDVRKP